MSTVPAIQLLPPPIDVSFGDEHAPLPQCTANLMPFGIDYDGPAPIDSFLVQQPAPQEGSGTAIDSFISAFRGRAIQSTPLPLPAGFAAKIVSVSQVVSSPASTSHAARSGIDVEARTAKNELERENKRRRIATQPPAKQQKFSMDSDDDDNEEEEEEVEFQNDVDANSTHDVSPPPQTTGQQATETQAKPNNAGPTIHIEPIAHIHPNHLTVWGPDGPIDKGDDSFFRTVGEWYSVVAPLLHA
ncbi:hypothetical protein EX895_003097 [Sporisorium graminicola]|uniref:Uncharacterized protein n=1 Tax=Sporisorium graminicola TaxID=280036 RepID=A0A4U7KTY1_9BASI|nr:hypothetical protein EX895_003097 [Sporisorium graminicola]TKY88001.1 hypothetical protein EX895_003097 [Sporisorium graminicola]